MRSAFAQFVDHYCCKKLKISVFVPPTVAEIDDQSDCDDDEDELPDCEQNEAVKFDNLLEYKVYSEGPTYHEYHIIDLLI